MTADEIDARAVRTVAWQRSQRPEADESRQRGDVEVKFHWYFPITFIVCAVITNTAGDASNIVSTIALMAIVMRPFAWMTGSGTKGSSPSNEDDFGDWQG